MKSLKDKVTSSKAKGLAKNAGIGAGIGLAGGLIAASATDKDSKERKELKAKVKAGTASKADTARLAELRKARKNRLLKAGAAGTAIGATAGLVGGNKVGAGINQVKANTEAKKEGKAGLKDIARIEAERGDVKDNSKSLDYKKGKSNIAAKTKAMDGVGKAMKETKFFANLEPINDNGTEDRNFSDTASGKIREDEGKSYVMSLIKKD